MKRLGSNKLERRLSTLELVCRDSMAATVGDFYARRPGKAGHLAGREKELYPQFAHVLLAHPETAIPTLLRLFNTHSARYLLNQRSLLGTWRAYRVSTIRRDTGIRRSGPRCFPGGCGHGAIADVVLLLNPQFVSDTQLQVEADLIVYFELKSKDTYSQDVDQLSRHLDALGRETAAGVGYFAAIGGRPAPMDNHRWLGHVSLVHFFEAMAQVAEKAHDSPLSAEIHQLLRLKASGSSRRASSA